MALTTDQVRKIATLARLRFTPEQEAVMAGQLGRIVDYIDQLRTAETGAPAVASHPAPVREADDVPHACLPRELFLANAPAAAFGAFLAVPEVKGSGTGE
jgi:aspartyl-tRNA(Asn)/glutamyl-tRNA(Gln) amidotransferase subunit C